VQWLTLCLKNGGQMNKKNSEKLIPTSLIAFLFLCVFWFLKVTGLLSGILNKI
jgi:hypothetical protein